MEVRAIKAMAVALGTTIPPGFRFRPPVTELILELKLKMFGNAPRLGQFMPTLDLAELDPWEILGELNMLWEDEERYFWRNREKLAAKGNQYNRKGKSGFWKSTCAEEEILDRKTNKCIGKKRILVYYKGRSPGKRTDWVIHEYALNNESASFVICILKEKTIKTEKTKKSKRAKKDADIPESLKGVPSGYTTVSDVENPITPAEISPTANSAVSDSIRPPNSTEGHNDMPNSHAFVEELDRVCDPDENIYGPATTDGSKKTSLQLTKFSNDDDNNKESSQKISSEPLTSSVFDDEKLRILLADDYIRGITDNFLNGSCQETSENQHFLDNPVSHSLLEERSSSQ